MPITRPQRVLAAVGCVFLALIALRGGAQSPAVAVGEIDAYLTRIYQSEALPAQGNPGAAVIVVKDGRVMLRKGYGLANLELGVPIAPEMVFRIGSITKQFTAVAVLMLLEDGKLSLDDEITKFVPDFPTHGQRITLEHLLTHTSGIENYTARPEFGSLSRKDMSPADILGLVKDLPLGFTPGEKWSYSNTGYFLLGLAIEKASGVSYFDFLSTRIFTPLGMTHTRKGDDVDIVRGRASGYEGGKGQWRNAAFVSMTQPFSAGALLSSVDDLALWDAALDAGKLLKPETLTRAMTTYRLENGKPTRYGFGWTVTDWGGVHYEEHGGGIPGFATYALRAPSERLFVSVLTNGIGLEPAPGRVAAVVAAMALGKPLIDPPIVKMDLAHLDRYAGVYRVDDKVTRLVLRDGDHLRYRRGRPPGTPIFPASDTEFFVKDSFVRLRFELGEGGVVTRMIMSDRSGPDEEATRTTERVPSADVRR